MLDYAGVAVEIWYQILGAVIDLPYILDTRIDREVALWRNSSRYHDTEVYEESERQRKALRLVCLSWRAFADTCRYRWITYDLRTESSLRKHKEAVEAIQLAATEPSFSSKPRRIMFHVTTPKDMSLFRSAVDYCSGKVTTLFVKCIHACGYEDQIFDVLLSQSSKLPNLRCLAIPAPRFREKPLRELSTAFPKLYTFTIWSEESFYPREGDTLLLPDLAELELDISLCQPATLRTWRIPSMTNLRTAISTNLAGDDIASLGLIRVVGTNLRYLNICTVATPIRLPSEFWTWCPCLVELLAIFSWVYLEAPAPPNHPLKYVVHWPHHDITDSPRMPLSNIVNPAILQNLRLFPPGIQIFTAWQSWAGYLELLAASSRYSQDQRENVLVRMNEIGMARSIWMEDQNRVILEDFLAEKSIGVVVRKEVACRPDQC